MNQQFLIREDKLCSLAYASEKNDARLSGLVVEVVIRHLNKFLKVNIQHLRVDTEFNIFTLTALLR